MRHRFLAYFLFGVATVILGPVWARPAALIDIESDGFGVRAIVLSDNPKVHVSAMIVDKTTGNIIAVLIG